MDWEFLENKHKTNRSAINLGDWAWAYNTTDRARNPVSLASADVFHIYNLALSYMFHPPRTFSLLDTYNSQTKHPEHTTWADLLDTEGNLTAQTKPEKGKEMEEPPDQQENKEYTVENILAFRWCPKEGREYYVQWKDYSGSWDTWQKENTIKHTEAFARFTLHTPQMIDGVSHFRSESEWKKAIKKKEPNPGDEDGEPIGSNAAATRIGIFRGIKGSKAHKMSLDNLYSVLHDSEPIGNPQCNREGPYKETCITCSITRGGHAFTSKQKGKVKKGDNTVRETTRHAHLECPTTILLLDTIYRVAIQTTGNNIGEINRLKSIAPNELVNELRLPLVTGHRKNDNLTIGADSAPDDQPFLALIAETHNALKHRRQANSNTTDWEGIQTNIEPMYAQIIKKMRELAINTRRIALERENELMIMYPNLELEQDEEGPYNEWIKSWVSPGWCDRKGKLKLPNKTRDIEGTRNLASASPWAWKVHPGLMATLHWIEGESRTEKANKKERTKEKTASTEDTVIYTDGAYDQAKEGGTQKGGFGVVMVRGGDGEDDKDAREIMRGWGQVITDKNHPAYLGADEHTNNTAELTALAEALRWLIDEDRQQTRRILIRPDSEYVAKIATGKISPHENLTLARATRKLYLELYKRREGKVGWSHVKGHSKQKWNDVADNLATKGAGTGEYGSGMPGKIWNRARADVRLC